MTRLSVAIAAESASPSAFVVWRGIERSIQAAADAGYDGVELALQHAGEIDPPVLSQWLSSRNLEISCISTGRVFAERGLCFTDTDQSRRQEVHQVFTGLIDRAADFSGLINIGRVRGSLKDDPTGARERFVAMARDLCDYAATRNVTLMIEPVNRYEIDFVNSVPDGAELLRAVGRPNLKLMPDLFHMNIEDDLIGETLERTIEHVAYIHFADSNRRAPGWGHLDFKDVLRHLKRAAYSGWVSVEILPVPDPDSAAKQAADYLRPLLEEYNAA